MESRRTIAYFTMEIALAEALYSKLERTIVPMYYRDPARYLCVMRGAIGLNASFFITERMIKQYVTQYVTKASFT